MSAAPRPYRDGSAAGRAVTLWRSGRWNTSQITEQVGIKEHEACKVIAADQDARATARRAAANRPDPVGVVGARR